MLALVAGLNASGTRAAIAVPSPQVGRQEVAPVVGCAAWRIPFGPLLRLPRRAPLPTPVLVHVHGLASLVPWSPLVDRRPWVSAVVATPHGILDWRASAGVRGPKKLWHERVDRSLLARLDGLHVTRPSEVESARSFLAPKAEMDCIPWALSDLTGRVPSSAALTVPRPAAPYILFVGRLHPIKGLERLLAALARLDVSRRPRLLLAGTGSRTYTADLRRHAKALGLRERVEFLGSVSGEALRALYQEATALVLPSRYENFGMVVLEALREGCPVIAARETPWAALDEAGAGRCVDFDNPDVVAAALTDATSPGRRDTLSAGARSLYETQFTPDRVVPRFTAWYDRILERASRGIVL